VTILLGKFGIFLAVMLIVGKKLIPAILHYVAHTGSRELFRLAVLAIALGIAYAATELFGVSLALGAFLAGAVISESDLSHQAAADALPLRDAFAVLFFVSVGMLVDPSFLLAHPLEIAAIVALIVIAKAVAAFGIVVALGYPTRVALTVSAALAQIGEFSFILATLGGALGLLPPAGFQLIVAGALISITINPVLFAMVKPLDRRLRDSTRLRALLERPRRDLRTLGAAHGAKAVKRHAILCGYGRVARIVAGGLDRRGFHYVVITNDRRDVEALRRDGKLALYGDASHPDLLEEAGIGHARMVIAAVNEPYTTRLIVDHARKLNPRIEVVTRTHSDGEAARLRAAGPSVQAVFGERELAVQMLRYALRRYGVSTSEAELIAQGLRRHGGGPPAGPGPHMPGLDLTGLRDRLARLRRARPSEPEGPRSPDRSSAPYGPAAPVGGTDG
jgi:CPA2 family monovalent cation:H+ antiporter-2